MFQMFMALLSARGIGPTKTKVDAVRNAKRPESVSEVRSFLGLANYCGKFIPDLATIADLLRKLTRQNEPFVWINEREHSFNTLKGRLTNAEILGYFDVNPKTAIIVGTSPIGLGALLVQTENGESRVICYASSSPSDVERRYLRTEKETLALARACEHFHMYVYCTDFELLTDHKALTVHLAERIQCQCKSKQMGLQLRLQPYNFVVKHTPGKTKIAERLSRLTTKVEESALSAENYICYVAVGATPNAMSTREIEETSITFSET